MIKELIFNFKLFLALFFGLVTFIASYIIFSPVLLITFKFVKHYNATMNGIFYVMDWIIDDFE